MVLFTHAWILIFGMGKKYHFGNFSERRFQKFFLFWDQKSSYHAWNVSEVTPCLLAIHIEIQAVWHLSRNIRWSFFFVFRMFSKISEAIYLWNLCPIFVVASTFLEVKSCFLQRIDIYKTSTSFMLVFQKALKFEFILLAITLKAIWWKAMKNDVAGYLSSQLAFLENIHKPLKDSVVFNCFGNDRICSTGYFLHFFNRLKIIKICSLWNRRMENWKWNANAHSHSICWPQY